MNKHDLIFGAMILVGFTPVIAIFAVAAYKALTASA